MKRFLVPVAIAAALATACSSGPDRGNPSDRTTSTIPKIQLVAALQAPTSCDDLLAWIRAEARTRVGPYGFGGGMIAMEGDVAARSADGTAEDSASVPPSTAAGMAGDEQTTESAAPDTFAEKVTGTNNQEVGVDEIDRFKTDGRRVVMSDGQRLMAIDIGGPTPRALGQVDLQMYDARLFLDGDRVIAVGTPDTSEAEVAGKIAPTTYRERVAVTQLSLAGGAPAIVGRVVVDGRLVSGRMTGDAVRLVLTTSGPAGLGFVSPNGGDPQAVRLAIETNQRVIDESTLEDWIPNWTPQSGGDRPLLDCTSVFHPASWSGPSTLAVLNVGADLSNLAPVGVIGGGETVYASTTGLYAATQVQPTTSWDDDGQPIAPKEAPAEQTSIHRFDVSIGGSTVYQGSGTVPGHVLNQFAMSERNGDLRVATTVNGNWWGGEPVPMPMPVDCPECAVSNDGSGGGDDAVSSDGATSSSDDVTSSAAVATTVPAEATNRSLLTVLRLEGNRLEQIGQLDGLGPNEQIQAVRFVDDRAYVVTFRQTDPLYVIDLADPTAPKVLGELKEPGFSAYLHPVAPNRMLGVGSSGTEDGRITGAKVALYDTSDPTSPRAVASLPIQDGYSSTGDDSHSFTWDAEHQLAFIPMTLQPSFDAGRSYVEPVAGVAVYRVEADTVVWVGWIDHSKHATTPPGSEVSCPDNAECFAPDVMPYASPVDRTVVVGDRVLAASMAGVSQVALEGFAETGWIGWS